MNALTCRARKTEITASRATSSITGTRPLASSSLPIENAAVNEKTRTPVKKPNACQTIGESRKRFSRGVKVVVPNWATRKRSE